MGRVSQTSVVREMAGVFLALSVITWTVTHVATPVLNDFGHLVLAAAFVGTALSMARREPAGAERLGIDLCGMLEARDDEPPGLGGMLHTLQRALPRLASELGVALGAAVLIFPPFALGFYIWHAPTHPFALHLPREPVDFMLSQLLVVALPEEALFRGYFQTRLGDVFQARVTLLGASWSMSAVLIQAGLFALLHFLVALDPARLTVFFPALAFAALRILRGGIGAAVWFHALCNLLSELLTRGFL